MPLINMHRTAAAAALVLTILATPAIVAAQSPTPTPPTGERGPFAGGGVFGVEFGGSLTGEAWNSNGSQEWIADGSFAIWWSFKKGRSIIAEFHAAPVFQDRPRTAFVNAFTPMYRWRILDRGRSTMFAEVGAGVSWSDTTVPPRGSRFNFLTVMSLGTTRRITNQTHFVASFRWLHLSNASRFGRNRNPDIEALGGYAGFAVGF